MTTRVRHRRRNALPRAAAALAAALLCLAAAGAVAAPAGGAPAKNAGEQRNLALIHRLIALTDTPAFQSLLTKRLVARATGALSLLGAAPSAQTLALVRAQTQAVLAEHIANGDALYSVLAPIYEKHFNVVELAQLVRFYQSPLGQKLVRVSPQLFVETLDLGSQWALSLVPEIVARVNAARQASSAGSTASP